MWGIGILLLILVGIGIAVLIDARLALAYFILLLCIRTYQFRRYRLRAAKKVQDIIQGSIGHAE